jgi:uncharacterized protein (DUF302 family)
MIAMNEHEGGTAMETTTESFAATSQARSIHLPDVPPDEARAHLRRALAKEGFALVQDVDLADLLDRRLDEPIEPYFIVEGCHPLVARRALAIAWDGGLIAPARFAVWKEGTGSTIATFPPLRLAAALGRPHLGEAVAELDRHLDGVFEQLQATSRGEPLPPEVPGTLDLDESERNVLADATRRHLDELMREVARTESRSLQHEICQTINRLEAVARKLGVAPSAAQ